MDSPQTVPNGTDAAGDAVVLPNSGRKPIEGEGEPTADAPDDTASEEAVDVESAGEGADDDADTLYYRSVDQGLALLPPYTRSLLKVGVPVRVTLGSTRLPLHRILELSPGTILSLDKPCGDPLTLEVAEQPVAIGEAVKVGDKFGLWVTSIALPSERFWVMSTKKVNIRAK